MAAVDKIKTDALSTKAHISEAATELLDETKKLATELYADSIDKIEQAKKRRQPIFRRTIGKSPRTSIKSDSNCRRSWPFIICFIKKIMRFIDELEGLVSSQLNVIKACLTMTKLEARLAGLSIYPLLINLCLLLACLTCVWLTAMGMLGCALMLWFDSALIAISCIFLFNTLLLGMLFGYLLSNLKNMSFAKTRAYLSGSREHDRNEFEKTDNNCPGNPGKKIMESTSPGK